MQEQIVLLCEGEPEALLQPVEDGITGGRCHYQTRLVIMQAGLKVSIKPTGFVFELDRFFKQSRKEALLGIGTVDLKNAHIFGECFDFKHRYFLRLSLLYRGNTVMIQRTEMTQRIAAGSIDCLIRDFTS